MKHLLGIEHISLDELQTYLHNSESFLEVSERDIKKVPTLRGKTIINLFYENSTRTRASFEIAGKRLSADTINISSAQSSTKKGESLLDTVRNLQAMKPDVIVVRHAASGVGQFLAKNMQTTAIANAGDGMHEHPTQALLDCLALKQHFKSRADGISGLKIAIVGDVRHSRVARSNIWAHIKLGNQINLVGPKTLVPEDFTDPKVFGNQVKVFHDLVEGIKGADAIMVLRMQLERQHGHYVPSLEEYTREYFLTEALVQAHAPNAVVMHPGPINRGVEVQTSLIDGPRSLVERQVTAGVAVRMAVLFTLATGGERIDRNDISAN